MEHTEQTAPVQTKRGGKRVAQSDSHSRKPLATAGIALAVLLALLLAVYLGLCAYAGSLDTFAPNRHINGIDVGGLTVSEAQARLETELLSQEITLTDETGETSAVITVADLGYTAEDFAGDAQFWMDADRQQSFLRKGWAYLAYAMGRWPGGASWPDMDQTALDATVSRLSEELSQEPVDSSYEVADGIIRIVKARDGRQLDEDALRAALADVSGYSETGYQVPFSFTAVSAGVLTAREIHDEVAAEMKNAGYDPVTKTITPEQMGAEFDVDAAQRQLDAAEPGETVTIDAVIEYPAVTAEELKGVLFRDVLGTATTYVSGTGARVDNVRLASQACNGIVLNSGDVFSYNNTTGERTTDKGYGAASAYVNGLTVDTIGGGVCQPSSTLYLACLNANLEIVERYAHRYPPSYIAKGMDATVSWGTLDYKFRNDTDYPIKIVATYSKGKLTMTLYGTKTDDITVKMTNKVLSSTPWTTVYEDDDTLPAGTEEERVTPYTGYKVETYRNLYDGNGNLISSTFEASSNYKVRNQVIARGTATADVSASGTADLPGTSTDPGTATDPGAGTDPGTVTEPETPPVTEPDTPVVVEPEPVDPGSEVMDP